MIKSKLDARERALELAIEWRKALPNSLAETTESMAEKFAKFLIGDAELPEVVDDNDNFKTLIDIINQEMVAFRKQGNDNLESLIKTLEERENGAMALTCKSDAE